MKLNIKPKNTENSTAQKDFVGGFDDDSTQNPINTIKPVIGTIKPIVATIKPIISTVPKASPPKITAVQDNYEGPSADDYKAFNDREHVYVKQGMYIGSDKPASREEWLYDFVNKKIIKKKIDFVPGCERIFLEILSNASDAVGRSRRHNVNPGKIIVTMNNKTISVKSHGLPMPIDKNTETGLWVPEMAFGNLRTGQNLEGERNEIGTNGIGSKATNIFSLKFTAIVYDHVRMKRYQQEWNTNMINVSQPDITPYSGKISSVEIIYEMDFARFGYPIPDQESGGYPEEAFGLFARHAMDTSFTAKVPVEFNDLEFQFSNIRDYGRLYFGDAVDTAIIHYQWPADTEIIKKKKGHQVAKNSSISPLVELLAIDTPDNGDHVSFVNCMMTRDGGVHVNGAIKAIGDSTVKVINDNLMKKITKMNKGKELDGKEKRAHTISINDVKPHISILLNVKLLNPDFESQSKTKLTSPKPKIVVPEEELKCITKWDLIDRLNATLEAKQFKNLSDKKGEKKYKGKNHLPANDSKSSDPKVRHKCTLCITEGDSGDCYATTLVSLMPNGRDLFGTLPMRGKGLNVMNAHMFRIENNAEFKELNAALGLVPGTDYSIDTNFNKLKYGKLMIMADADVDGKHITGLVLNYFHCRFPALLKREFVVNYVTPIISATRNRVTLKFYSERSYNKWRRTIPANEKWEYKYYKGLGSSKEPDVEYDKDHPYIIKCHYDDKAKQYFELAFHKKLTNERKEWITNHKPPLDDYEGKLQPISWFIDNELVLFSLDNVQRSIAKMTDGQKESHTKILHGMHKKWPSGSGKEIKIAQFAGYVAGKTCYHHGELILGGVITKMAQDFTGANNISYFSKGGMIGSRFKGGKDAANPRYTHTNPMPILSYIFSKEDRPLLKYKEEEGEEIEPETYITVVPMILINGTSGIATGWSSSVPSHNPLDIVNLLRLLLDDVSDLPPLIPWYRGFKGTIEVIDKRKTTKLIIKKPGVKKEEKEEEKKDLHQSEEESEEEPEEFKDDGFNDDVLGDEDKEEMEENEEKPKDERIFSILTRGVFEIDNKGTVIVTELPVGRWAFNYNKWLEKLKDEKKIKDYRDTSGKDDVHFEIYGFKGTPTHKTLSLERHISMSNMVLLDPNNRPKKYKSSIDILRAFYEWRLPLYQKRKDHNLKVLNDAIAFLNYKVQFIRAVIDKTIEVINKSPDVVHASMDKIGIPHEIYKKSKTSSLNPEGIEDCLKDIKEKEKEKLLIEQTPIKTMWLKDLDEFERAYLKEYAEKGTKKGGKTAKSTAKNVPVKPYILSDKPAQEKAKALFAKGAISPVIVKPKTLALNTGSVVNNRAELPATSVPTNKITVPIINKLIVQPTQPVIQPIVQLTQPVIQPIVQLTQPIVQPIVQPTQSVIQPIVQPTQSVIQPIVQPTQPVVQPTQPIVQPTQPIVQPTQPIVQPTQPIVQPTQPIVHPTQPIIQPTQPIIQPTQPIVQPTQPIVQPTQPIVQPTQPVIQPIMMSIPVQSKVQPGLMAIPTIPSLPTNNVTKPTPTMTIPMMIPKTGKF